jgi:hypothetical protein
MDFAIRKAAADDAHQLAVLLGGIGWFEAFESETIDGFRRAG